MQALNHAGDFVFFDYKREVDFRGALGNHADFLVGELAKNQRGDAGCIAQVLTDEAHDGFAALVLDVSELGKIGRECGDRLVGIDRQGNTDLRG